MTTSQAAAEILAATTPPEPTDNCGLPDGYIHHHTRICWRGGWQAGYEAGRKAGWAAAKEAEWTGER